MRRKKLKKSQLAFIGLVSIVSAIGGYFFVSDFANSSVMLASHTLNEVIGSPEASGVEEIISSFKVINKEAGNAIAKEFSEVTAVVAVPFQKTGVAFLRIQKPSTGEPQPKQSEWWMETHTSWI